MPGRNHPNSHLESVHFGRCRPSLARSARAPELVEVGRQSRTRIEVDDILQDWFKSPKFGQSLPSSVGLGQTPPNPFEHLLRLPKSALPRSAEIDKA